MNGFGGSTTTTGSSMSTKGGGTIAEKLGLGPSIRELKFGPGFVGGSSSTSGARGNSGASGGNKGFHTIRYDFKPASVDASQPSTVEVANKQITISIPHSDGAGTNVFKGPIKPYAKECVLIIDHETGEVTLEKLTHNIQVKKTRQERPEVVPPAGRANNPIQSKAAASASATPPPPVPPPEKKKSAPPPPPPSTKPEKDNTNTKKSFKASSKRSSSLLDTTNRANNRLSVSPGQQSPEGQGQGTNKPKEPNLPSLTSIEDLILDEPAPPPAPAAAPSTLNSDTSSALPKPRGIIASKNGEIAKQKQSTNSNANAKPTKLKSELSSSSSSGSESSSSSSSEESEESGESSESDDDEEMVDVDDIEVPTIIPSIPPPQIQMMKHLPMMPMLPSHKPKPPAVAPSMPSFTNHSSSPESSRKINQNHHKSMPTHLLSQDLRLSDSSDSDSE